MNKPADIQDELLEEILQIIRNHHGYDFSGYAMASLRRRIVRVMDILDIPDIYGLKFRILNDPGFFGQFLKHITVNVTEMFRDPEFFEALRTRVCPVLAAYPVIKIWHAGCATGEEVYSMCILLHEEGLLNRASIYATDINPANLQAAKTGIMTAASMKNNTRNYHLSGGKRDFSDYYTAQYNNVLIDRQLIRRVVFSRHNLASEPSFNEFHLIMCRNVMIYFNRQLQDHVLRLFFDSMAPKGLLALGSKESMLFSPIRSQFELLMPAQKIYRKK